MNTTVRPRGLRGHIIIGKEFPSVSIVSGLLFVLLSQVHWTRDCRYYRNCGQYSREAYDVTYTYPGDHWTFEKEFRGDNTVLTYRDRHTEIPYEPPQKSARERIIQVGPRQVPLPAMPLELAALEANKDSVPPEGSPFVEAYQHPSAPKYNGSLVRFDDVFPLSRKVYSYATELMDEEGKSYRIRVEWAAYYEVRKRAIFNFLKKRKHVHYVKVTINGRLLFLIDDQVDRGAYDYEDYFRLGAKKFRIQAQMQTNFEDYYFGLNLVNVL